MNSKRTRRIALPAILLMGIFAVTLSAHEGHKHPSPTPQAANSAAQANAVPAETKPEPAPMEKWWNEGGVLFKDE